MLQIFLQQIYIGKSLPGQKKSYFRCFFCTNLIIILGFGRSLFRLACLERLGAKKAMEQIQGLGLRASAAAFDVDDDEERSTTEKRRACVSIVSYFKLKLNLVVISD